jgi:hypothetical protein
MRQAATTLTLRVTDTQAPQSAPAPEVVATHLQMMNPGWKVEVVAGLTHRRD